MAASIKAVDGCFVDDRQHQMSIYSKAKDGREEVFAIDSKEWNITLQCKL